jgi:biopolymer transport protein ExbB/TolQ
VGLLTIIVTAGTVAVVTWLLLKAWTAQRGIVATLDDLQHLLADPKNPQVRQRLIEDTDLELHHVAIGAMETDRLGANLRRRRARCQSDMGRISRYIEVMPLIGLLGTVVGVIIYLLYRDQAEQGLWTALLTTLVGLLGAIVGKSWTEIRAEEALNALLARFEDPALPAALKAVALSATTEDAQKTS